MDWKGPKLEPNFPSIMGAYYEGLAHYDYENAYPVRVQPGDTIETMAALMAFTDHQVERFLVLNGLDLLEQLKPGELVKVVVD